MKYYDLHTHTTYSDGQASIGQIQETAVRKGYGAGISDHLLCGGMETQEAIRRYLDALDNYEVLKGCEANIGEDYSLPDSLMGRFDYVISSVHAVPDLNGSTVHLGNYFGRRAKEPVTWENPFDSGRTREYLTAVLPVVERTMRTQRMDIYGHCTVLPFCELLAGSSFLRDWENELISLCKKYHVALEISSLWKEPGLSMVFRARDAGLKFTLGSDCHLIKDICSLDYSIQSAQAAGLTEKDFYLP